MNAINRIMIRLLIVSVCSIGMPMPSAQAELVSTYNLAIASQFESDRQKLDAWVQREDVRAELESNGVNPAEAEARVDALSDAEAASIAGRIDSLPAGGDFIGALVFVFVLLLVTDILGFTKVYSFTRRIK